MFAVQLTGSTEPTPLPWKPSYPNSWVKAPQKSFSLTNPPFDFNQKFPATLARETLNKIWQQVSLPVFRQAGVELYARGEYQNARAVYSKLLASDPKNQTLRQLRYESNLAWLESQGEAKSEVLSSKIAPSSDLNEILSEMVVDRAALMGLESKKQKVQLGAYLRDSQGVLTAPLEVQEFFLSQLHELGKYYLQWSLFPPLTTEKQVWIRSEIHGLAAEVFNALAGFAAASSLPEIQKTAPYYQGLAQLVQEDRQGARFHLSQVEELADAGQLLQGLDDYETRLNNLAVVSIWRNFYTEKHSIQVEQLSSYLGQVYGSIDERVRGDGITAEDKLALSLERELELIDAVEEKLVSGEVLTVRDALGVVVREEAGSLAQLAQLRLEQSQPGGRTYSDSSDLIPRLIEYASYPEGKVHLESSLFDKTFQLATEYGDGKTVAGVYLLLKELGQDPHVQENVQRNLRQITKVKGFGDFFGEVVRNTDPEGLAVQVSLLAASAGFANSFTLNTMGKLKSAGVVGANGVALAHGVNVFVEGSALWTLNTGYNTLTRNPEEVFESESLLNSYAATLLMIGGVKSLARAGGEAGNLMARAAGLKSLTGEGLSGLGNALAGLSRTGFGLGGMVLSTQASQGLGFLPTPDGGFQESLAHDVVGYFRFAIAHRLVDRFSMGWLRRLGGSASSALAMSEAEMRSEAAMSKLQHSVAGRTSKGSPVFQDGEVQAIFENLSWATALRPGFHPERLSALVESGKILEAKDYGRDFGLKLKFEGGKLTELRDLTLHERLALEEGVNSLPRLGWQGLAAKALGMSGGLAIFFAGDIAEAATRLGPVRAPSDPETWWFGLGAILGGLGGVAAVFRSRASGEGRYGLSQELDALEQKLDNSFPDVQETLAITEQVRDLDQRVFASGHSDLIKRFSELYDGKFLKNVTTRDLDQLVQELPEPKALHFEHWANVLFILENAADFHYSRVTRGFAKKRLRELVEKTTTLDVDLLARKLREDPNHHGAGVYGFLKTLSTEHPNSHTRKFADNKLGAMVRVPRF